MVRDFNVNEYLAWAIHQKTPYSGIGTVKLRGILDVARLKFALNKAYLEEPISKLWVDRKEPVYGLLKEHPEMPIEFIDKIDRDNFIDVINFQLALPFTEDKNFLIRSIIAQSNTEFYLIVIVNHIVCDGISISAFLKKVLELYHEGTRIMSDSTPIHKLPNHLNLYPRHNYSNFTNKLKINNNTSVAFTVFQENFIIKLIQVTKKYKVTVQSFFAAVILKILIKFPPLQHSEGTKVIFPINLRVQEPENKSLSYSAVYYGLVLNNINSKSVWELAVSIDQMSKEEVASEAYIAKYQKLNTELSQGVLDDNLSIFKEDIPSIFVSNLGKLDIRKHYSDFTVESVHFFTSLYEGNADKVNKKKQGSMGFIFSTLGSDTFVDMMYTTPVISGKEARSILHSFKKYMFELCSQN